MKKCYKLQTGLLLLSLHNLPVASIIEKNAALSKPNETPTDKTIGISSGISAILIDRNET